LRFTLRQLEYFVAVSEAGSITEAARRVHGSQPTLSAAVSGLERSLGVQLFVRHHAQGVSLTPAGRRFQLQARTLLRQAAEMERFAAELGERVSGQLDLGCLVTLAPLAAPRLCREFEEAHPDARVGLLEAGQAELLDALRDGRISLALTYDLELGEELRFQPLADLPPAAMLPAGHRLAPAEAVGLDKLAPEPLILLDLPLSREYFMSLYLARGLRPAVRHRSPHPEVIRSMVASGYGYSLINARPRIGRSLDGGRFAVVPLRGRHRPMRVGLASVAGADEPLLVTAFRDHCRDRLPALVSA
jgi:DNA-binding transcriptional LysR family regulator